MSELTEAVEAWRDSGVSERRAKRLLDAEIRKAHESGMSEFAIHKLTEIHRLTIRRALELCSVWQATRGIHRKPRA